MRRKIGVRICLMVGVMILSGFLLVSGDANARTMEYGGINPSGRDSNYPGTGDYDKARHYWWKTSCDLLMGSWSEDTWRCSFDNHFANGAANGTDDEYVAYANELYQRGLRDNWASTDYFKGDAGTVKFHLHTIFMCHDEGKFVDPYADSDGGGVCRHTTWTLAEWYCHITPGKSLVWNRRTKECYNPNNPCEKAYVGWAKEAPTKEEMQKERAACEAGNGKGAGNGSGSNGSGDGSTEAMSGPIQKERNDECVSTAILGGGGEVCDSTDNGTGPINSVLDTVTTVASYGVGTVGIAGVLTTGVQYLTAGGSEEKVRKSKRRMAEIVLGVALYATIWTIVNWLSPGGTP